MELTHEQNPKVVVESKQHTQELDVLEARHRRSAFDTVEHGKKVASRLQQGANGEQIGNEKQAEFRTVKEFANCERPQDISS